MAVDNNLKGRVALVTGASGGYGYLYQLVKMHDQRYANPKFTASERHVPGTWLHMVFISP